MYRASEGSVVPRRRLDEQTRDAMSAGWTGHESPHASHVLRAIFSIANIARRGQQVSSLKQATFDPRSGGRRREDG